jgi:hypothetical protein
VSIGRIVTSTQYRHLDEPEASNSFVTDPATARIDSNRKLPALATALAHLGRLDEARSAVKAGLAINPTFAIDRARALWMAMSHNPTFLTQLKPILEGMRKARVPEE